VTPSILTDGLAEARGRGRGRGILCSWRCLVSIDVLFRKGVGRLTDPRHSNGEDRLESGMCQISYVVNARLSVSITNLTYR
jgi:hypothetical protein